MVESHGACERAGEAMLTELNKLVGVNARYVKLYDTNPHDRGARDGRST